MRSKKSAVCSCKVFLGGVPWDLSEQALEQVFRQFGQIRVEWPGKEQQDPQPKGFAYIIFDTEKQACTRSEFNLILFWYFTAVKLVTFFLKGH